MMANNAITPYFTGPHSVRSDRAGEHWMDGHHILSNQPRMYSRPWDDCIPENELCKENLPPFYVRLRDDQVGQLIFKMRGILAMTKFHELWPFDFDKRGWVSSFRDHWGPGYTSELHTGETILLRGGSMGKRPVYLDPGLPLTYTSSHKIMFKDISSESPGASVTAPSSPPGIQDLTASQMVPTGSNTVNQASSKAAVAEASAHIKTLVAAQERAEKETQRVQTECDHQIAKHAIEIKTHKANALQSKAERNKLQRFKASAQEHFNALSSRLYVDINQKALELFNANKHIEELKGFMRQEAQRILAESDEAQERIAQLKNDLSHLTNLRRLDSEAAQYRIEELENQLKNDNLVADKELREARNEFAIAQNMMKVAKHRIDGLNIGEKRKAKEPIATEPLVKLPKVEENKPAHQTSVQSTKRESTRLPPWPISPL